MRVMTVRLPDDLAARVAAESFRDRVSINKLVAYALLAYLDEKELEREAQESA